MIEYRRELTDDRVTAATGPKDKREALSKAEFGRFERSRRARIPQDRDHFLLHRFREMKLRRTWRLDLPLDFVDKVGDARVGDSPLVHRIP